MKKDSIKYIAVVAMLTAVSFVAVIAFKFVPPVAGILSYEPKDAVIAIAGFIFGPATALLIAALVSAIEMVTISATGIYGFIMNVVSTWAFALPATFVYKKKRTRAGAVVGLCAGVLCMAAVMVLWNYLITPLYFQSVGQNVTREAVAGMLATVFLPFNLVKGGINAATAYLLYKPAVNALRRTGLVRERESAGKGRFGIVSTLIALAALATLVLLLLVLAKVI